MDQDDSYVHLTQDEIHAMAEPLREALTIFPDVKHLEEQIIAHEERYARLEDRLSTIEAAILEDRKYLLDKPTSIGGLGDGILGDDTFDDMEEE